ncbi:MAG: hypothetical protein LBK07_02915 [Tannerella sp.]|nr:hypothetical protein [Tannerella sp.]
MKRILNISAGLLLACALTLTTTCSSPDRDDPEPTPPGGGTHTNPDGPNNPPVNPDDPDLQYMYVDRDSELGESLGEWDAAILGVNGTGYWCKFSDSMLPELFVIRDNIWEAEEDADMGQCSILFDGDGMPHTVVAGKYALVMANFSGTTFDMAIFYDSMHVVTKRAIDAEVDWDEYRAELRLPGTRSSYSVAVKLIQIGLTIWDIAKCKGAIDVTIAAAIAGGALGGPAGAIGAGVVTGIPTLFLCGSAVIGIADLICDCVPSEIELLSSGLTGGVKGVLTWMAVGTAEVATGLMDRSGQLELQAAAELYLDFEAEVSERNTSFFSADAIVTVKIYPGWRQSTMQNEFGILYGTKPALGVPGEERKRRRLFVSSSGDMDVPVPERITLGDPKEGEEPLDPNTTYYYCKYIVYNGTMIYGEIKSFKTKKPGLALLSPEQGAEVKPGALNSVEFYCFDPATNKPLAGIPVHFESPDDKSVDSFLKTDGEGCVSVYWRPDKPGASLTAKILDSKGNIVTECTFTSKINIDIVGVWECYASNDDFRSKHTYTFYPNGTFLLQFYAEVYYVSEWCLIYPKENFAGEYAIIDDYISLHVSTAQCIVSCEGTGECCSQWEAEGVFEEVYNDNAPSVYERIGRTYRLNVIWNNSQVTGLSDAYIWTRAGSSIKSAPVPDGAMDAIRYIVAGKDGQRIVVPEEK